MVDHRAEEDGDFRIFVEEDDQRGFSWSRTKDQISEWARQRFPKGNPLKRDASATRTRVNKIPDRALEDRGIIPWILDHKLPLVVSFLWLLVLGAYGVGYFLRLDAAESSGRLLPTADVLFFAFAIAGPISMIWVIVVMLNRAERLTEAITDQSESALALATTISTLNESVDALSIGTTQRLEDACLRMERDTKQSTDSLNRALDNISTRIDTTILDSVITLDKSNRDRLQQIEQVLAAERSAFADRLDSDAQQMARKIDESANDTKARLDTAIERAMARYDMRMEELNGHTAEALTALSEQVGTSVTDRQQKIDEKLQNHQALIESTVEATQKTIGESMERSQAVLQESIDATRKAVEDGVERNHAALRETIESAREAVKDGVERHQQVLGSTADQAQKTIENELLAPITTIKQSLDATVATLTANPPASAEEISNLLGSTAQDMIVPERTAILNCIERIEALEQQARSMLVQIDRTSRLNPVLAEDPSDAPLPLLPAARIDDLELPFESLPRSAERSTLDWTAVIEVLDNAQPRPANAAAMQTAAEDPDIIALMAAGATIESDLSEDGVFLEDLRPEHAPTSIWVRFLQGERGEAIRVLEGIDDDIASAIVRGKLRRTPEFRSTALKFATLYIGLLQRAMEEIGADQRLVELAESRMGRAFIALAGPLGLFDQRSAAE